MPTFGEHHRAAVLLSIDLISTLRATQLTLPTPCTGWSLLDLVAHMTAQHHGFAAAARGLGADLATWQPEFVRAAVADDPAGTYAAAAHDALAAFATPGVDEAPFALPEFGPDVTVPGELAMGFHFVDYVAHGWDVAVTLGLPFTPPAAVVDAVLPIAMAVPDGDFRAAAGSPFARSVTGEETGHLDRILRHLGRQPTWTQPYSTVTGA